MKRKRITKEEVIYQIQSLGLSKGDIVFLAADLLNIGYFSKSRENTYKDWVEILTTCVGEEGTIVLPSYTDSFLFYKKDRSVVFIPRGNSTTSGSLSIGFLNHSDRKRSLHPTNSCIAIGKYADYILKDHDQTASSYLPYQRIIELGGKNLMLGSFSDMKLAPMALHAAQETLGYTKRHWMAGILQSYFFDNLGRIKLFTRMDVGGCTAGAHKALGYHFNSGAIQISKVGDSMSAIIDTKLSYAIFLNLLKTQPELLRCDDSTCHHCYGNRIYNKCGFIAHWILYIFKKAISNFSMK